MKSFMFSVISGKGAASNAQIFNGSELKECLDDGSIGFPAPDPLPKDTENVPYFIGDDAFALRPSMMKLYSDRGMTRGSSTTGCPGHVVLSRTRSGSLPTVSRSFSPR